MKKITSGPPLDEIVEAIIERVSTRFGVSPQQVKRHDRHEPVAAARHITCHIMRYRLGMTLRGIGEVIGRTHASVVNSLARAEEILDFGFYYGVDRDTIDAIISEVAEDVGAEVSDIEKNT